MIHDLPIGPGSRRVRDGARLDGRGLLGAGLREGRRAAVEGGVAHGGQDGGAVRVHLRRGSREGWGKRGGLGKGS